MADLQDEYAARIRAIYERAELRILEEVRKRAARGVVEVGWAEQKAAEIASLQAWLRRQLPGLLVDVPPELQRIVGEAYDSGGKQAGQELIEANLTSPKPQEFSRGASVRAIANEAVGNLVKTHPRILRSALDAYRDVIAAGAEDVLTGVATRQQAVQRALNSFADRGVPGFVDKAGRRWDLGSYSDMATRSAVIRASVSGKLDKYGAAGVDTVIVSDHWEECPACAEWEGKVLSRTGKTPGYPTVDEAEAEGLFHPNCRHTIAPYVEGLTSIPDRQTPKDAAEQKRVYKERLTQRRLERGVRQWKRREMAALDPVEQAKASRKVIAWQKGLDAHIEAVNARRGDLDIPLMKKQPGRAQVVFAPDAVRSAREAAGFRRSVAAADRKAPPWAAPELRTPVPQTLTQSLNGRTILHVPQNIASKIKHKHSADESLLGRLPEVLARWQYAGDSPKGTGKKEVYSVVDGKWVTAVIATPEDLPETGVLVTLHRIKPSKVTNRVSQGYLRKRE